MVLCSMNKLLAATFSAGTLRPDKNKLASETKSGARCPVQDDSVAICTPPAQESLVPVLDYCESVPNACRGIQESAWSLANLRTPTGTDFHL